ncbi:MAG: hypothetical protein EAZ97_00695, partial [Bacteroidetes bacterium]
ITAGTYPSITTDQRGVKRVGVTDIGAHEFREDVVTLNTYTGTSVYGELGYAISNATAFTTIGFNLLGRYSEIKPTVALPVISQPVYVDGYSQPYFLTADFVTAFSKNTASVGISTNAQLGVSINGENLPAFTTVLEFDGTSGGSTVEGIAIHSALYGTGINFLVTRNNNAVKGWFLHRYFALYQCCSHQTIDVWNKN